MIERPFPTVDHHITSPIVKRTECSLCDWAMSPDQPLPEYLYAARLHIEENPTHQLTLIAYTIHHFREKPE